MSRGGVKRPDKHEARCRDCGFQVPVQHGRFVKHSTDGTTICPGWHAQVDDQTGWEQHLESRFTSPREDCPRPERWHSRDADSTEYEVTELVAAFVGALKPDVVVETGTALAQTALRVGHVLRDAGIGRLVTLEVDQRRVKDARELCKDLPVEVIECPSLEWDPVDNIGFAWLDSLHELRVPEFRRFYPHMIPGAFVGFHDTGPHQGRLADEILQLEAEGLLMPVFLGTPRGCAFAEVIGP